MSLRTFYVILWILVSANLKAQPSAGGSAESERKEKIIDKYLRNGAWKFHVYSDQWQQKIDEGLKEDSTIAYLWQQKAMPLYKQKRYAEGLSFLNQAVRYDRERYLDYRGFMKCVFSKDYQGGLDDFSQCIKEKGNSYVMDHSYKFYSALCLLQLKRFSEAEKLLIEDTEYVHKTRGETWVHHLDLLYLGIVQLQLKKFEQSVATFDKTLKLYPQFSEAHYYKASAQKALGDAGYTTALKNAQSFFKQGHTINEDNAIYEKYPFQLSAASFEGF
jgi:tetratricopeptide (TPR) repeat protein